MKKLIAAAAVCAVLLAASSLPAAANQIGGAVINNGTTWFTATLQSFLPWALIAICLVAVLFGEQLQRFLGQFGQYVFYAIVAVFGVTLVAGWGLAPAAGATLH